MMPVDRRVTRHHDRQKILSWDGRLMLTGDRRALCPAIVALMNPTGSIAVCGLFFMVYFKNSLFLKTCQHLQKPAKTCKNLQKPAKTCKKPLTWAALTLNPSQ
jgi:hypothetical protein